MKEFDFSFIEGLKKGLRSDRSNPRNSEALVECYNMKPLEKGLRPFVPLSNPFSALVLLHEDSGDVLLEDGGTVLLESGEFDSIDWPFPQLFIGMRRRILCTRTRVYELDSNWNPILRVEVTSGGRWDLIDYGTYVVLVNGSAIVYIDSDGDFAQAPYLSTMPLVSTGCDFKGQMVGGNVKSSWHDCGTGSVVWSRIGYAEFTPGDKNIEAGYRHLKHEGEVLRVLRLGDAVMVYGENEVAAMPPHGTTFGWEELLDVGLANKGALGGNEKFHAFVDKNYEVWLADSGLKPQKLGYQEFMENLTLADIVVSYDGGKKEFYIADSATGYLLTPYGMCQVFQSPTSVASTKGTAYGVFNSSTDLYGKVTTDLMDYSNYGRGRDLKTISSLEIGGYGTGTVQTALDYRYDMDAALVRSSWVRVNPQGNAINMVTAAEFRLCIRTSDYSDFDLDYITVRIKFTDRRFRRGKYVNQAYARSDS
jgi:hypothetical protein